MITQDQNVTTAFLSDAVSYGLSGPVETMETHISRIFLVADKAFKLKRAVKLPYADFSTPELRLESCLKEVRLNARATPELYLGVRRIYRRTDGTLTFDPGGELVDAVVEMLRFDQDSLFDRMALNGQLSATLMSDLTEMIVAFHKAAEPVFGESGTANVSAVLDINQAGFLTSSVFSKAEQKTMDAQFRSALKRHSSLLNQRAEEGKVRLCHGDLHLRNICLIDGHPRLFDCIEFNDRIATVDVLYDLAFLLMDLWHIGFRAYANLIANRYIDAMEDDAGFALLSFFMALRAAVRAHVTATQAEEAGGDEALAASARTYYDLALTLLQERPARLIAIGGFSGSGKTTIADRLAQTVGAAPGARVLESDRIRKALHGVPVDTRLGDEAYQPIVSERVYAEIACRSSDILSCGSSVVANAVFDREDRRQDIRESAVQAGAAFIGVWLETPEAVLRARVSARHGGQSDADLGVLEKQLARGAGVLDWTKVDGSQTPDDVVEAICRLLRNG
ncbi:bifunctional aminoglycoside phosphotransferase/ATP-binding protein [Rhizobium sp. L1K21]|uniref:bifunctional aminoglycoside phosphotransferase/ATP-binding protein n=1 Tax=Rhizobium sp. L1K21 TaxID=2954933 RepID=UPI0020925B1D|nr:bifunctional aminoglycoside phosphotransferase/ATP-binding protein [Rhizobium sp. L1K21]MCO6187673.1 AAA family ATPase [Rhizobium sp. L1K21]